MSTQRFWRGRMCFRDKIFLCICLTAVTLFGIKSLNKSYEMAKIQKKTEQINITIATTPSNIEEKTFNRKARQCLLVETSFQRLGVDLRIIILTYKRPHAVLRLLKSLNKAEYNNSNVVIEIWVDRFYDRTYSKETIKIAQEFYFDHGPCDIHIQNHHVGIQGQWLWTWRSYNDPNEIAVLLEDDLTVSPHFYTWLKLVRKTYGMKSDVSGFSLQGFSIRHNDSHCCLNIPTENKVFLYTTLGTSGFSPNNKHWTEFKKWSAQVRHQKKPVDLLVPNHVTWKWFIRMSSSIWEMEYVYYTWKHKQFTLYPNFKGRKGLTFNWMDDGLHSKGKSKNESDAQKGLVLDWKPDYEELPAVPVYVDTTGVIIRSQILR